MPAFKLEGTDNTGTAVSLHVEAATADDAVRSVRGRMRVVSVTPVSPSPVPYASPQTPLIAPSSSPLRDLTWTEKAGKSALLVSAALFYLVGAVAIVVGCVPNGAGERFAGDNAVGATANAVELLASYRALIVGLLLLLVGAIWHGIAVTVDNRAALRQIQQDLRK